jgi:hypothetical protein
VTVSDAIQLIGYEIEPVSPYDDTQTAVTLFWQATEPITQPLHVYLRLGDETTSGQHPANNTYPTNAWKGDEIVTDFHTVPRPILTKEENLTLEVALALPFTSSSDLDWQPVTAVSLPATEASTLSTPIRVQIGPNAIQSADFPTQSRPQNPLPVLLSGYGQPDIIEIELESGIKIAQDSPSLVVDVNEVNQPFMLAKSADTDLDNGRYPLTMSRPGQPLICGWLQFPSETCVLGEVEINGVALPETAVNYNDQIALLNLDIANQQLTPGGTLDLTLQWTALAPQTEDYTLFLQVLDANDRLVGQVDAWPLQGTLPTSQWQPGQTITDPYTLQLDGDLPPGDYRLLVGWYLLADLRRLPVLNEEGAAVDDKLVVPGLFVPE